MVLINDNSKVLHIGDPMPHFSLPSTDGLIIHSQEIRDPVLTIIFTCNHCPYAQAYEDRLVALAEDLDEEGVQFILINSNDAANYPEDDFAHMEKKVEDKGYPFPYCHDESQEIAKAYGALCTPHCFVFACPEPGRGDRERKLKYKGRVDDNWKETGKVTEHNLRDACRALAQGNEPPVHEANAIGCSIKWKE